MDNPTFGLPYDHVEPYPREQLDTMLARVKGRVFLYPGAGFLGSLLCDHQYVWDDKCATAWCNGETIGWNPKFFTWLTPEERITTLVHELWHTGYIHFDAARFVGKCPDYLNYAMDYVINNRMIKDGFVFGEKMRSLNLCIDPKYNDMHTEAVYEALNPPPFGMPMSGSGNDPADGGNDPSQGSGDDGGSGRPTDPNNPMGNDVRPSTQSQEDIIGKVVKAAQASKMAREHGVVPGETELIIDEFLNPILPWEVLLERYFTELSKDDYSWKQPSRRYTDDYLPSLDGDNGLDHLIYYLDISGSVSDDDILRFNSEVKHIHETFRPKRLTLITFDTQLQDFYEFTDDMEFEKIVVHGRGGTSFVEVEEHIRTNNPTAAIVFSDLGCPPMQNDPNSPILWVVVGNKSGQVPFGKMIHIDNERGR